MATMIHLNGADDFVSWYKNMVYKYAYNFGGYADGIPDPRLGQPGIPSGQTIWKAQAMVFLTFNSYDERVHVVTAWGVGACPSIITALVIIGANSGFFHFIDGDFNILGN